MWLLRIAFQAAGDEVAIGVATEEDLGHDVIETVGAADNVAEAVETGATLALVHGLAGATDSGGIDSVHREGLGAIAIEEEVASRGGSERKAGADLLRTSTW